MKKTAILLTTLALSLSTMAIAGTTVGKARWCGYQETLHIVNSPAGSKILSLSSTGGINAHAMNLQTMTFEDNGSCDNGTVHLKVGTDNSHYTMLTINDGPWYADPQVTSHKDHGNYTFNYMENEGNHNYNCHFSN